MPEVEDQTGLSRKERRRLRKQQRQEKSGGNGKSWLLWGGVFLAIVGVIIWLVKGGTPPSNSSQTQVEGQDIKEQEWIKGNREAAVTLIEYSDLQCPACASYYPMIKQLGEVYPEQLRIIYRHFPLRQIHEHAQLAAQTAEAAGLQGKFWEMHDLLFEQQSSWAIEADPKVAFLGYAEKLDLDLARFAADLDSDVVKQEIEADIRAGQQARVGGTPTFILNDKKIVSPKSLDEFKQLIQQELQ